MWKKMFAQLNGASFKLFFKLYLKPKFNSNYTQNDIFKSLFLALNIDTNLGKKFHIYTKKEMFSR